LIWEVFLRGISTRQVGRVVATLTGEVVSAQTVSQLTRECDEAGRQFHQAPLAEEWAHLFLDGVSLRMRRPADGSAYTCWWPTGAPGRHPPTAGFYANRPMVCFVNVKSVDRIIHSIFQRFNLEWKNRTLRGFI